MPFEIPQFQEADEAAKMLLVKKSPGFLAGDLSALFGFKPGECKSVNYHRLSQGDRQLLINADFIFSHDGNPLATEQTKKYWTDTAAAAVSEAEKRIRRGFGAP